MCKQSYSKGFRWRAGCKIPTVCLTKHPGRRRAEDEEQCYAKYDKTGFHEHLAVRANCIYHKLASEFEAFEFCLHKVYGDRVILYFKQSNIPYARMREFIFRETKTWSLPVYMMVDCKAILETRKWISFYTKKKKIDRLKNALKKRNTL